jgi:hypothetical protein
MTYFDPIEFLDFAKSMQVADEKAARVCVSRAYYAAHLSARQRVILHYRGLFPDPLKGGDDEHNIVREKLTELSQDTIVSNLLQLSRKRVRADYDLHTYSAKELGETGDAIELSQVILADLQSV